VGKTVRDVIKDRVGTTYVPAFSATPANIGTTVGVILAQNPSRIAFQIVNEGTFNIFMTPDGVPSSNRGVLIPPNGGTVTAFWEEDGEVVAWEWRAVAIGGASIIFITETLIARPDQETPP